MTTNTVPQSSTYTTDDAFAAMTARLTTTALLDNIAAMTELGYGESSAVRIMVAEVEARRAAHGVASVHTGMPYIVNCTCGAAFSSVTPEIAINDRIEHARTA